jgi:hypothetical protein
VKRITKINQREKSQNQKDGENFEQSGKTKKKEKGKGKKKG